MTLPQVLIYCDGACSPNPGIGGWGAVLIYPARNNHRKEISGAEAQTTNNRMEITAALKALAALKKPCRVELHTDSQYLLNAFEQGWLEKWKRNGWRTADKKSVSNVDLWMELDPLVATHEVRWLWVRGHSGNVENERADVLAVEARLQRAAQLAPTAPAPAASSEESPAAIIRA